MTVTEDGDMRRTATTRAKAVDRGARAALLTLLLALLMAALAVTSLVAQEDPGGRLLTLEDALDLARRNNPNFQSQRNDQGPADWQVREAYGAFLPTANASGGFGYTEAGVQRIGTLDFGAQSTDWFSSSYRLGITWNLDGQTLFGVPNARASSAATAARIDAAEFNLESAVTLQYMTALRARDGVEVARRQMDRARRNLQLVLTRVEVGAAAGVEGKQAEVEMGRAEVALIQAERQFRAEKLRLMEQMGVLLGEDVTLASSFEVFEPTWTRDDLLDFALSLHPSMRAMVAQERAGKAAARQARSQYFPSLSVNTAFSGNTLQALNEDFLVSSAESKRLDAFETCMAWRAAQSQLGVVFPVNQNCGAPVLTDETRAAILSVNNVFPFNFTKNPVSVSVGASIPVFTGFSRQRQIEQAEAQEKDAQHQRKAEELRLRTAVTEGLDALQSARRVVEIEERNRTVAEERLTLARQRYALGAAGIIELLDAETSMSTAERDYLNAVYQFHQALVGLEAATGRSLRPGVERDAEEGGR